MALIIETGAIVANADSYISVADARTFLEDYYGEYDSDAAAFLGNSLAHNEVILRQAAYTLDRRYRGRWRGYKIIQTQSLDWPRIEVLDEDGFDVPSTTIPRRVIRAQVEFAKRIAGEVAIFEDRARGGLVKSEKVDVIAIAYFDSAPAQTWFEGVDAILVGLLKNSRRIVRA